MKERTLLHSSHPLKLSAWLHADGATELSRIARLTPDGIVAAIARQDALFDSQTTSDEPQDPAGERQHPRVSKAPAPVPTLGKKAASGADPLTRAIAENDFEAFNEIESRAARGRG